MGAGDDLIGTLIEEAILFETTEAMTSKALLAFLYCDGLFSYGGSPVVLPYK